MVNSNERHVHKNKIIIQTGMTPMGNEYVLFALHRSWSQGNEAELKWMKENRGNGSQHIADLIWGEDIKQLYGESRANITPAVLTQRDKGEGVTNANRQSG